MMNRSMILFGIFLLFLSAPALFWGAAQEPPLKIAVASDGAALDARVAHKGARGGYLQFFDEKGERLEAIENPYFEQVGSAGVSCAYLIAEKGATVFVAGMVGSKMEAALDTNQITFAGFEGTVREAVEFVLSRR